MKTKLHFPGRKDIGSDLSGSSNTNQGVGNTVILNIERIEEFRPERNEKSLTHWEALEQGEIRVINRRRPQTVSTKVSV